MGTKRPTQGRSLGPGPGQLLGAGFGAFALGGVLAFVGWYFTGHKASDLAQWIEAVATALALVAAAIAAVYAGHAFGIERQREDRWASTQRSLQASVVAGWDAKDEVVQRNVHGQAYGSYAVLGVSIRNASDVPVTRVRALALRGDRILGKVDVPVLAPNSEPAFYPWPEDVLTHISAVQAEPGGDSDWQPRVDLLFTDAAGVGWHRSWRGSLVEISAEIDPAPGSGA